MDRNIDTNSLKNIEDEQHPVNSIIDRLKVYKFDHTIVTRILMIIIFQNTGDHNLICYLYLIENVLLF